MTAVRRGEPAVPSQPVRGRGLIIAGSILIVVAVVIGIIGLAVVSSQIDLNDFTRDVVIEGPTRSVIPGTLNFKVADPVSDSTDSTMQVGIAVSSDASPQPACRITDSSGADVALRTSADRKLLNTDEDDLVVVASASLEPGDYVATCDRQTVGSTGVTGGKEFTVGRTLGTDDVFGLFGPVLIFSAIAALAGLILVIGVVLLIVGLVQRNRSSRPPTPPARGTPAVGWGPPPYTGPPPGPPPGRPLQSSANGSVPSRRDAVSTSSAG